MQSYRGRSRGASGGGDYYHKLSERIKDFDTNHDEMNNIEKVVQVSKQSVGLIIGQRGSKLKEIRDSSKCKIDVLNDEGKVILFGHPDAVNQAERTILSIVENISGGGGNSHFHKESYDRRDYSSDKNRVFTQRHSSSERQDNVYDSHNHQQEVFYLEYPKVDVGLLIGSKGSTVKRIQEDFSVKIQVDTQNMDSPDVARIEINGNQQNIQAAVEYINNLKNSNNKLAVDSNKRKHEATVESNSFNNYQNNQPRESVFYGHESTPMSSGETTTKVIFISSNYCGRIIGPGGSRIRELQESTSASIKIEKNNLNANGDVAVRISGNEQQVNCAIGKIEEITSGYAAYNNNGQGGHSNSRDNNHQRGSSFVDESSATSLIVPRSKLGRVIGSQGSVIRSLQEETGTKINIDSNDQSEEATIEIRGGTEARANAANKIKELISDERRYDRYANNDSNEGRDVDDNKYNIVKAFYKEHPEITAMTLAEQQRFLVEQHNIILSDVSMEEGSIQAQDILTPRDPNNRTLERKLPKPIKTFYHALHPWPELLKEIERQPNFVKPSPIQVMMWPCLLSGLDVIGVAQTGSGKTLAFLLPAFIHIEGQIKKREQRRGPSVLILAPTRELAQQIHMEVNKYNYHDIKSICVYGGVDKSEQIAIYNDKRPEILVGTPGRVYDLIAAKNICLDDTTYVVLDEADRMLDLGFEPQVLKILYFIGTDRQTVMTTATWPSALKRVAYKFMIDPIQINVGSLDLSACRNVKQTFHFVEDHRAGVKVEMLLQILTGGKTDEISGKSLFCADPNASDKAIVFIGKKSECNYLREEIASAINNQFKVGTIHGDMGQHDRDAALEEFRASETRVLVATDIAARGLDITDVTHVINLDFPRNIEEYVHRIGRTARAGRTGLAITFLGGRDWNVADELISLLREAKQPIPETIKTMANAFKDHKEEQRANRGQEKDDFGFRQRRGGGGGRPSFNFKTGNRRSFDKN